MYIKNANSISKLCFELLFILSANSVQENTLGIQKKGGIFICFCLQQIMFLVSSKKQ